MYLSFPHTLPRRGAGARRRICSLQLTADCSLYSAYICDKWTHGMYRTERRQDMGRGARWQLARVARTLWVRLRGVTLKLSWPPTHAHAARCTKPCTARVIAATYCRQMPAGRGRSESDREDRESRTDARSRARGRLRLAPGSVSRRHFRGAASAVTHGSCRALSSTPCSHVQHALSVWVPLGGCSRNKGVSRH